MNILLENELKEIELKARERIADVTFIKTKFKNIVFVFNEDLLTCLIVLEKNGQHKLCYYKVNMNKWNWALQEGFDSVETFPQIAKEVLTRFRSSAEHLAYLGF